MTSAVAHAAKRGTDRDLPHGDFCDVATQMPPRSSEWLHLFVGSRGRGSCRHRSRRNSRGLDHLRSARETRTGRLGRCTVCASDRQLLRVHASTRQVVSKLFRRFARGPTRASHTPASPGGLSQSIRERWIMARYPRRRLANCRSATPAFGRHRSSESDLRLRKRTLSTPNCGFIPIVSGEPKLIRPPLP